MTSATIAKRQALHETRSYTLSVTAPVDPDAWTVVAVHACDGTEVVWTSDGELSTIDGIDALGDGAALWTITAGDVGEGVWRLSFNARIASVPVEWATGSLTIEDRGITIDLDDLLGESDVLPPSEAPFTLLLTDGDFFELTDGTTFSTTGES